MRKIFIIITLFTAGLVVSCETYEERQAELSQEKVEEVELEDTENQEQDAVEVERDTELGDDEIEVERE